jgi:hypothetical protein
MSAEPDTGWSGYRRADVDAALLLERMGLTPADLRRGRPPICGAAECRNPVAGHVR